MRGVESVGGIYPEFLEESSELWGRADQCFAEARRLVSEDIVANWAEEIPVLMKALAADLMPKWQEVARLESLEKEVGLLKGRCTVLERLAPILVPIESLAPEPYQLVKPVQAVVRLQNDQYIASFFDAGLSASGDTQMEAVANLKDVMTATFEILTTLDEKELGPGPLQQRKVLEEFIRAQS